jgi:hypothetical protein
LEISENSAKQGYVTGNRNGDWGASNKFYPIIRLSQLHHVAINSGYARLLSLNEHEGRELVKDADNQQVCWVRAEPWGTQIIVENAFTQASENTRGPQPGARCKNRTTWQGRNTEQQESGSFPKEKRWPRPRDWQKSATNCRPTY